MIINLLINLILLVVGTIFSFLPVVGISDIPFIGTVLEGLLIYIVHMWNAFIDTFPYAQSAWNILLVVIIPFEITMLIAKFFFHNRVPDKDNHNNK